MPDHYDSLETRDREERERALMAALPKQIAHAVQNASGWARNGRRLPARMETRNPSNVRGTPNLPGDLGTNPGGGR